MKNRNGFDELLQHSDIVLYGIGNQYKKCFEYVVKHWEKIILIDGNQEKWGTYQDGYEILAPDKIKEVISKTTAVIISSIYNQYEIAKALVDKYEIDSNNIFCYLSEGYIELVLDMVKINKFENRILTISDLFSDQQSKDYFINSYYMRKYLQPLFLEPNPYMEKIGEYGEIINISKGDVIIDCGAYTGDTAKMYMDKVEGNCRIYALEPFESSFKRLLERIENEGWKDKVFPYQIAVGKTKEIRCIYYNTGDFDMTMNINSKNGVIQQSIKTDTLDNLFGHLKKIDYIKMDIEGEEANALKGAEEILKKFKPKLLISAYHRIEDFWVIPELIKEINPDYKMFVGHAPGVSMEMEYYFC